MTQVQPKEGFNLSKWALDHPALTRYLMVVLMLLGIAAYFQLGQDEDPPFTFRAMVVRTYWPGRHGAAGGRAGDRQDRAHPARGAPRRQDPQLFQARRVADHLPDQGQHPGRRGGQRLVHVRKKVNDMRYTLPQGVVGPFFNDDFGDVYGVIYALAGPRATATPNSSSLPTMHASSCCVCPMSPRSSCSACRTKSCTSKSRKSAWPNWAWT